MPTYKGVEVWIEDAENQQLDHLAVSINLVDDRTVTAKTEMPRDKCYTIHCLSPVSVFCEVFIFTASHLRHRAARFYLDKALAMSKKASGSSANHTEGRFRDHGLRTPKRSFQQGKLGAVEVEIRRIGEIVRGETRGEYGGTAEFLMIDDFDRPPWLLFHFDISAKESSAELASAIPATEHIKRHAPYIILKNRTQTTSGSQLRSPSTEGSRSETLREGGYLGHLHKKQKHPRHNGSVSIGESSKHANSGQLYKEFQKEEAEERRLLHKLQERLETKKKRNTELRRLLGETS